MGKTTGNRLPRYDGWEDAVSGLGVKGVDQRMNTRYRPTTALDPETLRQMYVGDGMARKVVRAPVLEMTRRGFDVLGDTDGKVNRYRERLKIDAAVRKLLIDARLFGGAILVLGLDDGRNLDEPLDENRIRSLAFARSYHRWRLSWTTADLYQDPENPNYGTPEFYTVQPITQIGGGVFRVHATRVIRAEGEDVDDYTRLQNWTWGNSVLQAPYDALRSIAAVYAGSEIVVKDFVQRVFSIKGLSQAMATGNKAILRDRMDFADVTMSMLNAVFLDADEAYQKHSSSIAGLPDLVDRFGSWLAGQTEIPVSVLLNKSPGGLNANGNSERDTWYDTLTSKQQEEVLPVDRRICELIFQAKDAGFGGKIPEGFKIEYKPLRQMTEAETAALRKTVADTDAIYLDRSVTAPAEVRDSRFGGDRYSMETIIDDDLDPQEDDLAKATKRAADLEETLQLRTGAPVAPGNMPDTDREPNLDPEPPASEEDKARGDDRDFGGYAQAQELRFSFRRFRSEKAVREYCANSNHAVVRVDRVDGRFVAKLRNRADFKRGTLHEVKLSDDVVVYAGTLR